MAHTIKVGTGVTNAQHTLPSQNDVIGLLNQLVNS
jgi:hypothetical protein